MEVLSGTGCGWLGQFHCGAIWKVAQVDLKYAEEANSPEDVVKKEMLIISRDGGL